MGGKGDGRLLTGVVKGGKSLALLSDNVNKATGFWEIVMIIGISICADGTGEGHGVEVPRRNCSATSTDIHRKPKKPGGETSLLGSDPGQ